MPYSSTNSPADRLRPVSSRQNTLVKDLRRAFAQGTPLEDGTVAIEGLKLVEEALQSGLPLRAAFFTPAGAERATRLIAALPPEAQALLLPDEVFDSAVASESPQGVAALIQPLSATLADLFRPSCPLILGCAGLQDPGNLGTILRSAEAFGASGVLTTEGTVAASNPKVARASAGSVFRLPCLRTSTTEAIAALRRHRVRLAVTSSHNGRPVHEADLTRPTAIFIGNEGQGVPAALLEAADEAILIPHSPRVESLNAGIAASLLLYEAARQRQG